MKRQFQAVFCVLLVIGCDKSMPTEPLRTPTPAPTATPVPTANIAGAWSGTFNPSNSYPCSGTVSASATFVQNGAVVSGNVSSQGCTSITGPIQGSLRGTAFSGTLRGSLPVGGTAADRHISLRINGGFLLPNGTLTLDR